MAVHLLYRLLVIEPLLLFLLKLLPAFSQLSGAFYIIFQIKIIKQIGIVYITDFYCIL